MFRMFLEMQNPSGAKCRCLLIAISLASMSSQDLPAASTDQGYEKHKAEAKLAIDGGMAKIAELERECLARWNTDNDLSALDRLLTLATELLGDRGNKEHHWMAQRMIWTVIYAKPNEEAERPITNLRSLKGLALRFATHPSPYAESVDENEFASLRTFTTTMLINCALDTKHRIVPGYQNKPTRPNNSVLYLERVVKAETELKREQEEDFRNLRDNDEQDAARELQIRVKDAALKFIPWAYSRPPKAGEELEQLLAAVPMSPEERSRVLSELRLRTK
jgi:hypothetical protein